MSVVKNFWLKGQSQKLAGAVIYQAMGQTRARSLANEVRNPRTISQMNQRVKWANLVNLYRANQSWLKYAFETKKATQTDYNKFMSLNVTGSNIFLPKQIAAAGGCVVQAYLITQGSLPSIETVYDSTNERWATNLFLGENFVFTTVSVKQFSKALIDNNPAVREGDQLSFIRMTQMTNADNGAPYVIVRKYEVVLSLTNNANIFDFLPVEYIDSDELATNSALCIKDSGQAGGFVLVLSRTTGGKTYVSSQRIVVANNSALISAYSSQAALNAAIASYGESDEPFLTSTSASIASNAIVPNSILNVSVGTVNHIPGSRFIINKSDATKSVRIECSSDIEFETENVMFRFYCEGVVGSLRLPVEETGGTVAEAAMPAATGLQDNCIVYSVELVGVNSEILQAGFFLSNEDTIQGLE